jgi:hypothetical protein
MKKIKSKILLLLLLPTLVLLLTDCSSRIDEPIIADEETIIYPAKQADEIVAKISFCRRIDKKSDEVMGEGQVFSLIEDGVLYAVADIENQYKHLGNGLMFHCDWIAKDGKSLFCKQIEISPGDSNSSINSSISISPEKREAGEYYFKLYYFRELIAEKKFELLPALTVTPEVADELAPEITLYRAVSKSTGKLIGEGSVFEIKDKRNVRASVELKNRFAFGDQELMFHIDWIGPDGESIYRKRLDLYPTDSTSIIESSISISPDKRQAGNYKFQLLLFNTLIAEQPFELQE